MQLRLQIYWRAGTQASLRSGYRQERWSHRNCSIKCRIASSRDNDFCRIQWAIIRSRSLSTLLKNTVRNSLSIAVSASPLGEGLPVLAPGLAVDAIFTFRRDLRIARNNPRNRHPSNAPVNPIPMGLISSGRGGCIRSTRNRLLHLHYPLESASGVSALLLSQAVSQRILFETQLAYVRIIIRVLSLLQIFN
jgi:hypothetical protein